MSAWCAAGISLHSLWDMSRAAATWPPSARVQATCEPYQVDVAINDVWICRHGATGEERSKVDLTGSDVHIVVDLHAGQAAATIWTNDLTTDYVHENSAYST